MTEHTHTHGGTDSLWYYIGQDIFAHISHNFNFLAKIATLSHQKHILFALKGDNEPYYFTLRTIKNLVV